MTAILENFGSRTRQSDPVVHFYETFLAAYNSALRKSRGVYYTPEPVVSYIVRSVDAILKNRLNLPLGLADNSKNPDTQQPRVQILDPCNWYGHFSLRSCRSHLSKLGRYWEYLGVGISMYRRIY